MEKLELTQGQSLKFYLSVIVLSAAPCCDLKVKFPRFQHKKEFQDELV